MTSKPPTPAKPTEYSPEIALELCVRIASGRSLLKVSLDPDMPTRWTVYRWLEAETEAGGAFPAQYARAREMLMDHLGDEILEIADTPVEAVRRKVKHGPKVKVVRSGDDGEGEYEEADVSKEEVEETLVDATEHRKLQIATRQWVMERTAAKKWGRSDQLRHADADGNNLPPPIPTVFRAVEVPDDD